MKLQDSLPTSITVDGRKYKCDFDFRNVLKMLDILANEDYLPQARDFLALRCVLKHPPKNVQGALEAVKIALFPHRNEGGKKLTSFEQDADLIRAAFLQEYGINLFHDRLHWLEFATLLNALPEGSRYSEVLGIRARPMPKATKWNHEEREWLAKAKAACALEVTDRERQQNYVTGVKSVFVGLMGIVKRGDDNGE